MKQIITVIKRSVLVLISSSLLLVPASVPFGMVSADDCVSAPAPSGIDRPTGADEGTYTYNSCGYYENAHFTWSPSTHVTTPKVQPTYTYNADTGMWDAQNWYWSPAAGAWKQRTISVSEPPAGAPRVGAPAPAAAPDPTPAATAPDQSSSTPATNAPSSATDTSTTNNQAVNATNNSTLNNTVNSNATSGNAMLLGNVGTGSGGATSGNAQAIANIFNLLQSSTSAGANVATFVANVNGDVQGDLVIDPSSLQPAVNTNSLNNNVDVNIANNGSITNDITLAAQSGDATVAKNVGAGDAVTGNAQAIANVVNMMNSLVSANQSFLGVININGNLDGNILMPQNFLDALIASNAPKETVSVSQDTINNLSAQVSNDQTINNNVTSNAVSGSAVADKNTNTGALSGAATGTATTNVTIFNLANNQISGGNTMLVFVNVLGKWVGVIMDAPAGATAAALGGGVNTVNTVNTANNNVNFDVANKGTITNNIDVAARSGNALLSKNVNAGNARSGNAATAVNIANLTNSTVNLTGWFGILFINVFGNWNGNFGVATSLPAAGAGATANAFSATGGGGTPAPFGFSPTSTSQAGRPSVNFAGPSVKDSGSGSGSAANDDFSDATLTGVVNKVLGASTTQAQTAAAKDAVKIQHAHNQALLMGGVLCAAGLLTLLFSEVRARR